MMSLTGIQPSTFNGGLDDLESFQAWGHEIKAYLAQLDPALFDVLEQTASSPQPIEEDSMIQASAAILEDKHKALRVLQAKTARASLSEEEARQLEPLDENNPPAADQRSEYDFKLELERNKLQVKNHGRQLGFLLAQKTQGETQLQVKRWLQSTNGWEAWRQLNLLFTTSKRSHHFKLLQSLMTPSFDSEPASFLQQYDAWKEQVVRYQQLSGDQIPDFIQLSAVVNGLKSDVSHYVRLYLASDSSFSDLDVLLRKYFNNTFVTTEASLNAVWDKAWRDKQQGGKENGGKSKPRGTGAAYPPQPQAHEGEWEQEQLPKRQRWCDICWKQGHTTQACWYNPDQQQQQQHQTEGAQLPKKKQWCNLCWKKGHSTQACWWNDNQQQQQQHLQHQAWYHPSMQQQPAQQQPRKLTTLISMQLTQTWCQTTSQC